MALFRIEHEKMVMGIATGVRVSEVVFQLCHLVTSYEHSVLYL